ncbi:MAG: hypothetical protein R2713_13645 [Ilumatobacteraceae bacterium]
MSTRTARTRPVPSIRRSGRRRSCSGGGARSLRALDGRGVTAHGADVVDRPTAEDPHADTADG